jgi:hypothetical protein
MSKTLLQRKIGLLAAAGTVALLALVAIPVAAGANGNGNGNGHGNGGGNSNNRLLAAGTATERLGGGVQWHIQFQIHARNNGKSSKVSVQTPTSTFSYVGSVCSGSYTTAAGTTVYVVGRQTSFAGTGFEAPYYGYSIHKGGPMGADFSWVSSFASLAAAQAACANPAVSLPTPFALDAASVRFKV